MENIDIGSKIKALRMKNKMTLKQLSEKTGFSVGFLSQLERGMTSIAIDSLADMAKIFGVPLNSFFETQTQDGSSGVTRSYEKNAVAVSPKIIQYTLGKNPMDFSFLTREFHLMPNFDGDEVELYHHEGEVLIYVLEGVLTLKTDEGLIELYPGDSIHIHSENNHNWLNRTNKVTKVLCVNTPNPLGKN